MMSQKTAAVVLTLFAALAGTAESFVPASFPQVGAKTTTSTTSLQALDRRQALATAVAGGLAFVPAAALAADYVPKFDDMKQIYFLGASLDRLVAKFSNEDTVEAGLENVRVFNRDANFYPGYARNFISKSVKNNADGDPRVGYVRQACKLISSTQTLLEEEGLMDMKKASKEAVERVKKAQSLIAKFLAESGVESDDISKYVSTH